MNGYLSELGHRYARLFLDIDPEEMRLAYGGYVSDDAIVEAVAGDVSAGLTDGTGEPDAAGLGYYDLSDRPELEAERNFLVAEMKKISHGKTILKNTLKTKEATTCN